MCRSNFIVSLFFWEVHSDIIEKEIGLFQGENVHFDTWKQSNINLLSITQLSFPQNYICPILLVPFSLHKIEELERAITNFCTYHIMKGQSRENSFFSHQWWPASLLWCSLEWNLLELNKMFNYSTFFSVIDSTNVVACLETFLPGLLY